MSKRKGQKKCKQCREFFTPFNTLQPCCSPKCAVEWGKSKDGREHVAKERRKANKAEKQRLNQSRKSWWLNSQNHGSTQYWFNRYIRLRDADKPCVTCGTYDPPPAPRGGQWDCGHYKTVGGFPELRFDPSNAHKQCKGCNNPGPRKADWVREQYEIKIVERVGQVEKDRLDGPNDLPHLTIDDLREIRDHFKRLTKELERRAA